MKKIALVITAIFASLTFNSDGQIAGTLDSTFNTTGKFTYDFGFQDNITDVKVQPADGKIIVVGTAITPSFSGKLMAARLLPDGGFDSTFNDSGIVIIPNFNESYAYECFVKNDGKIIVAGASADPSFQFSMLAMRLNSDGTLDSTFGTNGMVEPNVSTGDDFAYAAMEQPDHKILLAGTAIDSNFRNAPTVVRLNEDGSIDSTFGTNGITQFFVNEIDNEITAIAIQNDGKILISGHIDLGLTPSAQFDFDVLVIRLNSDGTPDSSFGTNGIATIAASVDNIDDSFGMQITDNGSIVVGGFTTQPDFSYDALLLQLDSTGALDTNFGTNGIVIFDNDIQDIYLDLKIQTDGKILLAGTSGGFFFDDRDFLLSRYNSNGTPDITFGNNGFVLTAIFNDFDEANAMAIQVDGKIILAGKGYNGVQNDMAVVRYFNDITSSTPELESSSLLSVFPNPTNKSRAITIQYESKTNSSLQIEIFNIVGDRISLYTTGIQLKGINQFNFQLPAEITSGIYLVRITENDLLPVICKLIVN